MAFHLAKTKPGGLPLLDLEEAESAGGRVLAAVHAAAGLSSCRIAPGAGPGCHGVLGCGRSGGPAGSSAAAGSG